MTSSEEPSLTFRFKQGVLFSLATVNDLLLLGFLWGFYAWLVPANQVSPWLIWELLLGAIFLCVLELLTGFTPGMWLSGQRLARVELSLSAVTNRVLRWGLSFGLGLLCLLVSCFISFPLDFPGSPYSPWEMVLAFWGMYFPLSFLMGVVYQRVERKLGFEMILKPSWVTLGRSSSMLILICLLLGFLPSYPIGFEERSKISWVKVNAQHLLVILELYAQKNQGHYPESIAVLEREAKKGDTFWYKVSYWEDFRNPFTGQTGVGFAVDDEISRKMSEPVAGLVTYQVFEQFHRYVIYGHDKTGAKMEDKGKVYFLSNGD